MVTPGGQREVTRFRSTKCFFGTLDAAALSEPVDDRTNLARRKWLPHTQGERMGLSVWGMDEAGGPYQAIPSQVSVGQPARRFTGFLTTLATPLSSGSLNGAGRRLGYG
jgi:hypothetical protein